MKTFFTLFAICPFFFCQAQNFQNSENKAFFSHIFSKKEINNSIINKEYTPEWEIYCTSENGNGTQVLVNLGLLDVIEAQESLYVGVLSLQINTKNENGIASDKEMMQLLQIEKNLQETMEKRQETVHVGHLCSSGFFRIYNYLKDTISFRKTAKEILNSSSPYNYSIEIQPDPEWQTYQEKLFPAPDLLQNIYNQRLIKELRQKGDIADKVRPIEHTLSFPSQKERNMFLGKAKTKGFIFISNMENPENEATPYRILISKTDKTDGQNINQCCSLLWEMANECNGIYEGWQTNVIK